MQWNQIYQVPSQPVVGSIFAPLYGNDLGILQARNFFFGPEISSSV